MRIAICGADTDEIAISESVDCVDRHDAELIVTVGEEPLSSCARRTESRPILPVGLETPLSPSRKRLPELLARLPAEPPTVEIRPLSVTAGGSRSSAVFDTTLVTAAPARISEYSIAVDGRTHATFRADGVVVATPLGSSGYARAAGGPQLEPAAGLAVVPIAPFATHTDSWVVQPPLSVSVERDDSVTVFADTSQLAVGAAPLAAEVTYGDPLSIVDLWSLRSP